MTKKPGKKQGMDKEHIKAELRILFGTMRAFADQLGVDESLIRHTLRRPQPRTERLIAEALGTTAPALWPERYTDEVLRNGRHWRRHLNAPSAQSNTARAARSANFTGGN